VTPEVTTKGWSLISFIIGFEQLMHVSLAAWAEWMRLPTSSASVAVWRATP